jgi:hypothetical protein
MRKLLLATTALLGGTFGIAGLANAQTTPAPTTSVPIIQFGAAAPTPGAIPSKATAPFTAVPGTTPAPSTITVRLDGRVNFYAAVASDGGRNPGTVTTAAGTAPVATNTKLSDYTFLNYIRLYPSFDGVTANGLQYGGFLEIRQDNAVAPGGGINGSVSAATRSRGQLYVRDDFVYLGAPQLGQLRLGSTWGPATLFQTGLFENFNDGGWNGDLPVAFTGNAQLAYPFPDVGALYTMDKVVYISPQVAGFDFSASFAPSTANVNSGEGNCAYANTAASASGANGPLTQGASIGCDATASTSVFSETHRPRDTVEAELRYRGAFGPIGLAVEGGGIFSGKVGYDGVPTASSYRYDDMEIGDGGLQVTYGGLALGGHITAGRSNGTSFLPVASNGKDAFAWLTGGSYAVGPVIVGATYFQLHAAGNEAGTTAAYNGMLRTQGIAAGGTYTLAPGMNVFLSYLYGHQHEHGTDLLAGTASTAAGFVYTHNNLDSQGASVGLQFRW